MSLVFLYIERQVVHAKPIGDFVQFWINQDANEFNISIALDNEHTELLTVVSPAYKTGYIITYWVYIIHTYQY